MLSLREFNQLIADMVVQADYEETAYGARKFGYDHGDKTAEILRRAEKALKELALTFTHLAIYNPNNASKENVQTVLAELLVQKHYEQQLPYHGRAAVYDRAYNTILALTKRNETWAEAYGKLEEESSQKDQWEPVIHKYRWNTFDGIRCSVYVFGEKWMWEIIRYNHDIHQDAVTNSVIEHRASDAYGKWKTFKEAQADAELFIATKIER